MVVDGVPPLPRTNARELVSVVVLQPGFMGKLCAIWLLAIAQASCGAPELEESVGSIVPDQLEQALTTVTATFLADADTRASSEFPDQNYGSSGYIASDGSPATRAYLRFVASGIKGTIVSAQVKLRVTDASADGPAIYATSNNWGESSLTWNNRPLTSGSFSDNKAALSTGTDTFYDVTPLVKANGTYSFILASSASDGTHFSSRETAFQPQLIVTVEPSSTFSGISAPALVAASHPLAAQAGADVLRNGGNAIDAAAATALVLSVVEPHASGIGGGSFWMIYRPSTGVTTIYDGRERAPAAATPDQFLTASGTPMSFSTARTKGFAVGVPGLIRTIDLALSTFGTRPMTEVIARAISLADNGFAVNSFVAAEIANEQTLLASWPASAAIYLPGGVPMTAGTILKQPDLARTLRLIRDQGASVFYSGEIALAIVAAQSIREGRMTVADLGNYQVRIRVPLTGSYRTKTIVTMPPPSSGGVGMLQMLAILEPFVLRNTGANTKQTLHLMLEAMHLAYADRAQFIGDTDYVSVPLTGLLHPDYIAARRALIDPRFASTSASPGDPWAFESGARTTYSSATDGEEGMNTTHFVIIDRWGNIVTSTQTIESSFGTGMVVPGYGFLLNNELTDFNFAPGGANQVEPGKRPRSSKTPTIVFENGTPVFVLGSPGGARIITTVTEAFLNVVEHNKAIQPAIDMGRVHFSKFPSFQWEGTIGQPVIDGLRARGHVPASSPSGGDYFGAVQAAVKDPATGIWTGGADNRREGSVIYVR